VGVDPSTVPSHTYSPMKMEQTECSETSAYKIQTPGNYPEERIQHSEHGESLKSRIHSNLLDASKGMIFTFLSVANVWHSSTEG
jgi:hypothetical protein